MSHSNSIPNNITIKGIDLSHMPEVKIEEVPGKRSYGRRFRVVINGNASEEMVLKKILRQINKISKVDKGLPSGERLTQLKSVQKLLVELKNANTAANENYDKRGNWYKFRTWFHRLGNKGTHEENIAKLENKLKQEIKETTAPIETFLEDNLNVFQVAKESQGNPLLKIEGYDVITTKNPSTILIKDDSNELKISFHNGEISEILLVKPQIETLASVPELFVPILKKAFESTITSACSYNAYGIIVVQSSLKEFPAWHLNKLAEVILKNNLERDSEFSIDYAFNVIFMDDDLRSQAGIDTGGLRRAYVSTLVDSIQNQNSLFSECKHGLKCPRIEGSKLDTILNCTKDEETIYNNLGMLLRCNYNSAAITTGVYFNDVLFNTALNFDYAELQTPFAELTRETHIRLALALVQELPTNPEGEEKANMLTALDLCDRTKLDQILDQEDQKAALKALSTAAFVGMDDDGMEPYLEEDFLNANLEAIKENREAFIDQLYQSIFSSKSFIGELGGASLGQVLSPIHNVARGMAVNDRTKWNQIKTDGFHNFSLKAQGEIDRQVIHDALNVQYNIKRESDWLKEWILNDATNEDIQNFLKFASGSASLPEGQEISIRQGYGNFPIGHSCYYRVDLPRTSNKDKFIENLKMAILTPDFGIA